MLPSVVVLLSVLTVSNCAVSKIDWSQFPGRDAISQPDRVLAALDVGPGLRVADLGAGDGYFTPKLAAAVGPDGHVWAVEVDEDLVTALRALPALPNAAPIEVVHGDFDDPKLPDGEVDLVLLSSVYHHIEGRVAYMEQLRTDLAPEGRVAILEPAAGWASLLLLLPPGHAVAIPTIREELEAAGYRHVASHAFLPGKRSRNYIHSTRARWPRAAPACQSRRRTAGSMRCGRRASKSSSRWAFGISVKRWSR